MAMLGSLEFSPPKARVFVKMAAQSLLEHDFGYNQVYNLCKNKKLPDALEVFIIYQPNDLKITIDKQKII